jgi:hypothetical protein
MNQGRLVWIFDRGKRGYNLTSILYLGPIVLDHPLLPRWTRDEHDIHFEELVPVSRERPVLSYRSSIIMSKQLLHHTHQVLSSEVLVAISAPFVFPSVPKCAAQMLLRQGYVNSLAKAYTFDQTPTGEGKALVDSKAVRRGVHQLKGLT